MAKLQLSSKGDQQNEPAAPPSAPPPPPPPVVPDAGSPAEGRAPTATPPPISTPPPLPASAPAPSATSSAAKWFLGRLLIKIIAFFIVTGVSLGWYFMNHDGASLIGFLYGGEDDTFVEEAYSAEPDEITYDQRDDWPAIELMGMVAASRDSQASAILNGTIVVLNQRIEGAKLVEILPDGVILEYERDRKHVLVGQGTL